MTGGVAPAPGPGAPAPVTGSPAPDGAPASTGHGTASLRIDGRALSVEHRWIAADRADAPLVVFLHEGLGSVAAWRDFPQRLCDAARCRGLVYSRPGYGRSTPRAPDEAWAPDFMHGQAHAVLPVLLEALGVDAGAHPPFLFGHSDGGSIALLHAARFPGRVAGVVALAPHLFVEEISLGGIRQARAAYVDGDLRARLARHHDDPDSAFWGWNRAWLDPRFRDWNIEEETGTIACPVLAIQGTADAYGTLEQIRRIATRVPGTRLLELEGCGHAPHAERPAEVLAATVEFIERTLRGDPG